MGNISRKLLKSMVSIAPILLKKHSTRASLTTLLFASSQFAACNNFAFAAQITNFQLLLCWWRVRSPSFRPVDHPAAAAAAAAAADECGERSIIMAVDAVGGVT